jgi:hypothetical protein
MPNNGTNFNASVAKGEQQNEPRFLPSMLFPIKIIITALSTHTITLQAWKIR